MKRHFLSVFDLSRDDIFRILDRTGKYKQDKEHRRFEQPLTNSSVGMIFEKLSTRTRVSFEVGINDLGGKCIYMDPRDMQLGRGETISDTAKVLSTYLDGVIIRTYEQERIEEFADSSTIPVINALTDREHPTQILSDLYSIQEKGIDIENFKLAYVGDGNNISNSFIAAAAIIGFKIAIATPSGFEPDTYIIESARRMNVDLELIGDPVQAVKDSNVIYTDVWISMGQQKEKEKVQKAFEPFQVNRDLVSFAENNCLIMHCLPAHRGVEITEDILDSENSIVLEQAENKLHSGKSILEFFMGS